MWSIRSGEQLDVFLQHILRVFHEFLPHALISERWAQTAIQLGLSCSSRHYAGRSLQVYRQGYFYLKLINQFWIMLYLNRKYIHGAGRYIWSILIYLLSSVNTWFISLKKCLFVVWLPHCNIYIYWFFFCNVTFLYTEIREAIETGDCKLNRKHNLAVENISNGVIGLNCESICIRYSARVTWDILYKFELKFAFKFKSNHIE